MGEVRGSRGEVRGKMLAAKEGARQEFAPEFRLQRDRLEFEVSRIPFARPAVGMEKETAQGLVLGRQEIRATRVAQ